MLAMRNLYRVAEAGTCTFGQVGRQASIFGGMVMALHPALKRKKNPQGPRPLFVEACSFAPVACALGYKSRSLAICPHGDTRAKFLGMTPGSKIVANLLKQLAKLVYHRASP
jgi:hypothetical protein